MELDYYGGFSGASNSNLEDYFSYDIGMLYYDYPGHDRSKYLMMVQEKLIFLNIMVL